MSKCGTPKAEREQSWKAESEEKEKHLIPVVNAVFTNKIYSVERLCFHCL